MPMSTHVLLMAVVVGPIGFAMVAGVDVPAGACSALISSSLKNIFQSSSGGITQHQAHANLCTVDTGASYSDYEQGFAQGSGDSRSLGFNLAFNAQSEMRGQDSSSGPITLGFLDSRSKMSQSTFEEVKTFSASYQNMFCSKSGSSVNDQTASSAFSSVLPPEAFSAYASCLEMYKQGVQITQTDGIDATSTSLDIVFTSNVPGAVATWTALTIQPPGSATCKVFGTDSVQVYDGTQPLPVTELRQNVVMTVFCALNDVVCRNLSDPMVTATTIALSTSPGGTYRAYLKPSPSLSQLQLVQQLLDDAEANVKVLQQNVIDLRSSLEQQQQQQQQSLQDVQTTLQGKLQQLQDQLTTQGNQVSQLQTDSAQFVFHGDYCVMRKAGKSCPQGWYCADIAWWVEGVIIKKDNSDQIGRQIQCTSGRAGDSHFYAGGLGCTAGQGHGLTLAFCCRGDPAAISDATC